MPPSTFSFLRVSSRRLVHQPPEHEPCSHPAAQPQAGAGLVAVPATLPSQEVEEWRQQQRAGGPKGAGETERRVDARREGLLEDERRVGVDGAGEGAEGRRGEGQLAVGGAPRQA